MTQLPTGTVTFLFSDIEGSTRLTQSLGDAWPGLLARHQEILREAFTQHGGVEVGTDGDSFFVVFPAAVGAVAAATAGQRRLADEAWPEDGTIRVRMGLHSGEASVSVDTYVGLDVHRAARIAAAGHGGQVLLSDTTKSLAAQSLPEGVELRDLGVHRLKDLVAPERLWQLIIAGLPSEFPALGGLDAAPNNLPTRLTTFLGRTREIAEVSELLMRTRLLTLTGPGGTGKTRLSLEVASSVLSRYPDGVWFVELATISEPDLVASTIAQSLGLPDRGGRSSIERLTDHLRDKRVLLVLDNFEQVVEAAPAVAELFAGAPNLSVIVTSRSALHIYGEQEYPVPPLGVPDPRHLPRAEALSQYEAVALFIERAMAVKPDFRVTNENAPAVAEICVRLDGLPLAIELAAARIRILPPQAMLSRLESRLGLLSSGGSRDLPERQQTLRGAIAWSHDMLDETDRSLFACASVFVGGASLDAIEHVCGSEVSGDILDTIASLVDKSLVRQAEGIDGEPRFAMLETIREFAMEQLVGRGRWDELRCRHGELFTELAEAASQRVMSSEKRIWLDRLEQDHDNLRAAIAWAIDSGRAETAMRLSAAMWRFWQMRGYLAEGLDRARQALAVAGAEEHPEARARALNAAAGLAYWQGEVDEAQQFYNDEIEQRRTIGDRLGLAEALYSQSFTFSVTGVLDQGQAERAAGYVEQALAIFRELGDRAGIARCLWAMANVDWGSGRAEQAVPRAHEALAIFRELDDRFMVGWTCYTLGTALLQREVEGGTVDDRAEARQWLDESLRIFAEARDVSAYTLVLDAFAMVALRDGDRERAARISAAVESLVRSSGAGLLLPNREVMGFDPAPLRADPALAEAWAEGERMTAAEAVAYALEEATAAV